MPTETELNIKRTSKLPRNTAVTSQLTVNRYDYPRINKKTGHLAVNPVKRVRR
jgi:hypothetical protein